MRAEQAGNCLLYTAHYYVDSTQDGVDITATAYKNSYTITIDGNTATGGEVYRCLLYTSRCV